MPAFTRTPTRAKFYMWAVLLGAFFAPFGIIQYQLSVQRPLFATYSLSSSLTPVSIVLLPHRKKQVSTVYIPSRLYLRADNLLTVVWLVISPRTR